MNWEELVPALYCETQGYRILTLHGIVVHAECYHNIIDSIFCKQLVLIYIALEAGRYKIKVEEA